MLQHGRLVSMLQMYSLQLQGKMEAMLRWSQVVYRYEREKGHTVNKLPTTDSEGDGEDITQARHMVTIGLHLIMPCFSLDHNYH